MALVKETLKNDILSICNSAKNTQMSEEEFSTQLANAIDTFIKTAVVNVSVVVSSGSSAGTWAGVGSLS